MKTYSTHDILFFMQALANESPFARKMCKIINAKETFDPHPHPKDALQQPIQFRIWAFCKSTDDEATYFFLTKACKERKTDGVVFSMADLFGELAYFDEYTLGPFYSSYNPDFMQEMDKLLEDEELSKIYSKKENMHYNHLQKKVCKFLKRKTGFNVYKTESENRDEFAFDLSPILEK